MDVGVVSNLRYLALEIKDKSDFNSMSMVGKDESRHGTDLSVVDYLHSRVYTSVLCDFASALGHPHWLRHHRNRLKVAALRRMR